jgi:microcystin-dependent protein
VDVPVLGIQTGDSLSYVEQALIEFLTSTLDATGIIPEIDPEIICPVVGANLPNCATITAKDLFVALIKAACVLQTEIAYAQDQIDALEADYSVDCLDGVTNSSNTHNVLQAVINKLCELEVDVAALAVDLDANYVKLADLDTLIQAYLDSIPGGSTQQYLKMVPYTAVEYYGPLSNFDSTGKGLAALGWDKIYLCNGANGTPDKRGRSPIGAIQGVPSTAPLSPVVDPAIAGNTNYALNSVNGQNNVTLVLSQIPSHTHTASVVVNDPGHTHNWGYGSETDDNASGTSYREFTQAPGLNGGLSQTPIQSTTTGLNGTNIIVSNASQGGGQSHNNVHPVLACYYIIYLP